MGAHGPGQRRSHVAARGRSPWQLVQTLSRTVEAAKHELNLARTPRAKAEEEADAIRAAAGRDAADLLAHTRNGVQALLQELSRQLDVTTNETLAETDYGGPKLFVDSERAPCGELCRAGWPGLQGPS